MIRFALGELGYPRVLALTHPDNAGGNAVLGKLKLHLVGEASTDERDVRLVYACSSTEA